MNALAAEYSASRDAHIGREGFWAHGLVTPTRAEEAKSDAAKLTFPLQLVIAVVTVAITVYGSMWAANSKRDAENAKLASDIRDIHTMMEMQVRVDSEKAKVLDLTIGALRDQMAAVSNQMTAGERRQELLRLEFQQLREQVLFGKKAVK